MNDNLPPQQDPPEPPSEMASEEDLIMRALQSSETEPEPTGALPLSLITAIPDLFFQRFAARKGSASKYRLVPLHVDSESVTPQGFVWRIELHGLKVSGPLGFDIVGDVVIGRGTEEDGADIDLDAFDALDNGVSRRHALLRPTQRSLYLIDLASTNGTQHNAIPLSSGSARKLQDHDTITLGRLSFTVEIIGRPPPPDETPTPAAPPTATVPQDDSTAQSRPDDTPGTLPAVPPDRKE